MHFPKSKSALVVESNYLVASVIETPLVARGYRVLIASSPGEALRILAANSVHLAVIDFRLPHAEPGGLVSVLASRAVPYIVCTAASVAEVVEAFPGAVVLEKPFSDDDLLAAVTRIETGNPEDVGWRAPDTENA